MDNVKQELLNRYFSSTWLARGVTPDRYRYSGWSLLDHIGSDEMVLDVGCGNNWFKDRLNVVGVDPVNEKADQQLCIEDFETDQRFDVALCLGSINFGTEQDIEQQIEKIISLLKANSRIYWRCNPGLHDHDNPDFLAIDVFPWSFDHHRNFSKRFGYRIADIQWDSNNRIYSVWSRP